jgi:hypothetical protein
MSDSLGSGPIAPSRFKESLGLGTSLGALGSWNFSFRSPGKFIFEKEVSRGTSKGRSLAYVTCPHKWRISVACGDKKTP